MTLSVGVPWDGGLATRRTRTPRGCHPGVIGTGESLVA
jgi:hypothetical protein